MSIIKMKFGKFSFHVRLTPHNLLGGIPIGLKFLNSFNFLLHLYVAEFLILQALDSSFPLSTCANKFNKFQHKSSLIFASLQYFYFPTA